MENDKWICEICGEPIQRCGNKLFCENGCFEDDIRNNFSEDEIEEKGIPNDEYPIDNLIEYENLYSELKQKQKEELKELDFFLN